MSCARFFRADKGTANFNSYRTLMCGLIGGILLLLTMQPAMFLYDRYGRQRPWIQSHDRAFVSPTGHWVIASTTTAAQRVAGSRTIAIFLDGAPDEIVCMSERRDSWEGERLKHWTVDGFVNYTCPIPSQPFFVCSEFSVSLESGASATFLHNSDGSKFCTDVIDPAKGAF